MIIVNILVVIRDVVRRLKEGDEKSLESVMSLYQKRLFNFALLYVHSEYVAEEIVNDVFIALWNKKEDLRDTDNILSYLLIITKNLCLNYLRKERLELVDIDSLTEEQIYQRGNMGVLEDEVMNNLLYEDCTNKIYTILKKLPPKTREIFLMSRQDGKKNREIAAEMNLLEKSIEYHITKALGEIRKGIFE